MLRGLRSLFKGNGPLPRSIGSRLWKNSSRLPGMGSPPWKNVSLAGGGAPLPRSPGSRFQSLDPLPRDGSPWLQADGGLFGGSASWPRKIGSLPPVTGSQLWGIRSMIQDDSPFPRGNDRLFRNREALPRGTVLR